MNDRALKVLEQYELDIISTRRGRGSYILETPQGLRILCDYTGSENKALFQNCVMNQIRAGGYEKVDVILPNKEGSLISRDWEENKYVVKEWYTGRECDTASESEIMAAVGNLARLHRLMHLKRDSLNPGVSVAFTSQNAELKKPGQDSWEKCNMNEKFSGKELYKTADLKVAEKIAYGDTQKISGLKAEKVDLAGSMSVGASQWPLGMEQNKCEKAPSTDQLYDRFYQNFTSQSPQAEIRAQNAELKKIRTFIRKKNTKGDFERLFLDRFTQYFEQAQEAEEKLSVLNFSAPGQSGSVCHGDYNHHHILMSGYDMATTNFECCRFDFQVNDLYRFMRKILEKHDWNPRLGMRMLENYTLIRPLPQQERRLLYVRMLYPEKFRKLANYYYGSNKAWISRRYLDKLEKLNRQEGNKNQFVRMLER